MKLTCDDVRDLAAGFVLGALTPDEEAAVRDHLAGCPDAHAELAELGGVVPYLAGSLDPIEPPATLRARLLETAAAERRARPAAPIPFPSAVEREVRTATRSNRLATWGLRIAAILAILALGAWNLQLQSRLSGVEGDLAAARAYQDGVAAVLDVGTRSGAQTAFLGAAKPGLKSTGVAAAAPDGTVVMVLHDLAPTAGTEVYEAWVIVGSQAPVPLGGFTVGGDGTGIFRGTTALAQPGAVLALSLEPLPGPTAPAGPIVSVGSLLAPSS